MDRFLFGVVLLLGLLGLGLWTGFNMEGKHQPIAQNLEQAAQESLSGDLESGVALAKKALDRWEKGWHSTACAADHDHMDEIDGLFAQTMTYAQVRDTVQFAAGCARLARLVEAVGEAHRLNLWNLL